jgi:cytochrome c553
MKMGNRNGTWTPLMQAAVKNLTTDDLVSIAAFTASRMP